MRICITNPCWKENGGQGIRAGCRVPNIIGSGEHSFVPFPFLLAYTAAVLEKEGHEVMLLDAIAERIDEEQYYQRIVSFKPQLVINEMSAASFNVDLSVASKLKELIGTFIAVCGPHPTAIPEEVLSHNFIDFVLLGEMEGTALELAHRLQRKEPLDNISGLAYRNSKGEIVLGKRRPLIEDLDSLPYPHREALPLKEYRVAGYPMPVLFMYSSRGCPFRCNYCLWPQTMYSIGSYRARKPRNVVEEIVYTLNKYGPFRSIYFDDDTFNIDRKRLLEFANELEKQKVGILWGCNARADLFDPELMKRLASVGLFNLRIGVESGDSEILRRAQKNLNLDKVSVLLNMAHRYKVKVHATFTIGLSGESWDSVKRTVAFAKSIPADSVAFTIATPFPGTAYFKEVVDNGFLMTKNWSDFNVVHSSVIRTQDMTAVEITQAEKYAMRKVYLSAPYLMRRLRYFMSINEVLAVFRKGIKLLSGRY